MLIRLTATVVVNLDAVDYIEMANGYEVAFYLRSGGHKSLPLSAAKKNTIVDMINDLSQQLQKPGVLFVDLTNFSS